MKPSRLAVLGIALAVLLSAGMIWLGYTLARAATGSRETVSSAPIVTAVSRVARLATVRIEISDVVRYEEVRHFLILDFPKSATLRLRGSVLGGFDLDRGGLEVSARPARRTVEVVLPRPRVLSVDPRIEWFDERAGIFNPITPEDRTRWLAWARASLARDAKEAGLEREAREQAAALVTGAAAAFGWKARVSFRGETDAESPSPAPEVPHNP
jgi:hypothetical protein